MIRVENTEASNFSERWLVYMTFSPEAAAKMHVYLLEYLDMKYPEHES